MMPTLTGWAVWTAGAQIRKGAVTGPRDAGRDKTLTLFNLTEPGNE